MDYRDRRARGWLEKADSTHTHTHNSEVLEPSCDDNRSSHPTLNTTRPDSHGQKECEQQHNAAHHTESKSHIHSSLRFRCRT